MHKIMQYSRSDFSSWALVQFAQYQTTKILIAGTVSNSSNMIIDAYNIDYASLSYNKIGIPRYPAANSWNYFFVGDYFSFWKDNPFFNSSRTEEEVYFLSGGVYAVQVLRNY